jgi:GNAT superfamily N-acetyltransferase
MDQVGGDRRVLADGTQVLIRPLLPSDRAELAAGFVKLSAESRRRRFFDSDHELDDDDLDYLTHPDQVDHVAIAALRDDGDGAHGVAVGRYIRDPLDRDVAEVAVTVQDDEQGHGIGTLLVWELASIAAGHGVKKLVSYALWVNESLIDLLVSHGGHAVPSEPGIARVDLDLTGLPGYVPTEETSAERGPRRGRRGGARPTRR